MSNLTVFQPLVNPLWTIVCGGLDKSKQWVNMCLKGQCIYRLSLIVNLVEMRISEIKKKTTA